MNSSSLTDAERPPEDTALDVALLVMQNGGSTAMADTTFRKVLRGLGQENVFAVWRLDVVTAGKLGCDASAIVRPIGVIGMHLLRASEAVVLADRVAEGAFSANELPREIERIEHLASPYDSRVTFLAAGLAGAFFSQTAGGDAGAFGIAFVAASVGQFMRMVLQARYRPHTPVLPRTPITFVAALLSALVGAIGLRLGLSHAASATLIASVVYMIPGVPLINGFIDVVSTKHLFVGVQRLFDAAFVFVLLAIAVAIADVLL